MIKKPVIEYARKNLVTCPISSSIPEIANIMIENGVGSVFLADDKGKIVGMITDKAIFLQIAKGNNPVEMAPESMMEVLYTVSQEDPALDVLEYMKKNKLSRVGIKDENGRIIGVISQKKLKFEQLRILKEELGIRA
ncbi:MAG: CBS domain-containing protein [Promethearchaeota archaeon]